MTSGGAWILWAGILILWVPPTLLGVSLGRRARTPGTAFLRGMAVALVAAGFFAAFPLNVLQTSSWVPPPPPWLAWALLLLVLPPGLLAGMESAMIRSRLERRRRLEEDKGRPRLSPDLEQAARARFHPSAKLGDAKAIRPADDGLNTVDDE